MSCWLEVTQQNASQLPGPPHWDPRFYLQTNSITSSSSSMPRPRVDCVPRDSCRNLSLPCGFRKISRPGRCSCHGHVILIYLIQQKTVPYRWRLISIFLNHILSDSITIYENNERAMRVVHHCSLRKRRSNFVIDPSTTSTVVSRSFSFKS